MTINLCLVMKMSVLFLVVKISKLVTCSPWFSRLQLLNGQNNVGTDISELHVSGFRQGRVAHSRSVLCPVQTSYNVVPWYHDSPRKAWGHGDLDLAWSPHSGLWVAQETLAGSRGPTSEKYSTGVDPRRQKRLVWSSTSCFPRQPLQFSFRGMYGDTS